MSQGNSKPQKSFREKQVVFALESETAVIGDLIQLFIFEKITLTVVEIHDTTKLRNVLFKDTFNC
jgi:hypothetical protein